MGKLSGLGSKLKGAYSKLNSKVRSLQTGKVSGPSLGTKLKGAYSKLNGKSRSLQTYALRGDMKNDIKSGVTEARRRTTVNNLSSSLKSSASNAVKSAQKFKAKMAGMSSRGKYAATDYVGGVAGGNNIQAVNNTGSVYRRAPMASAAAAAGRKRNLRKTRGGGARINTNLGKVGSGGKVDYV